MTRTHLNRIASMDMPDKKGDCRSERAMKQFLRDCAIKRMITYLNKVYS